MTDFCYGGQILMKNDFLIMEDEEPQYISLIELTINNRTTGAVDLLRSYSFTGEHPGKVWARHLRGDIDHVMI